MSTFEHGWRFRPMLVGEVARAAGVPRETLRVWLRRDFSELEKMEGGWKRFTDFEAIVICVFAALVRYSQDHELARLGSRVAADALFTEWNVDERGVQYLAQETFDRDRFMIFWRNEAGNWEVDLVESPKAAAEAMTFRFSESYAAESPAFTMVNFGTVMRSALKRMIELQSASPRADGSE